METNEDNIKVLVKLGLELKDLANIYLNITQKGQDVSKQDFINNLTDMIKFFQTRNKGLGEDSEDAIYKEDVLEMIQKNKKLISLGVDKKIKPTCDKLDSYYFMNPSYTNKVIKNNPKIFSVNKIDLEIFSTVFSGFAIKTNEETVNAYEYVVKHDSELLNKDVQKVYQRVMFIKNDRNSNLLTNEDLKNIQDVYFKWNDETVDDIAMQEKYTLPKYSGETIAEYKEKIKA